MTVAVISSVYGGYDVPAAPAFDQTVDAEYVLVTDTPVDCPPWRTVIEPRPSVHPRFAAKVAKARPDLYSEADTLIWVDASFQIIDPCFVEWAAGMPGPLAQIVHPERSSLEAEADVSAMMAKYEGLPVRQQVRHYRKGGYPDEWGLWATGFIVYQRGGWLPHFGNAWLAEQARWSYQDQLSEPPVLWSLGLRPHSICEPLWGNRRFAIRAHASDR